MDVIVEISHKLQQAKSIDEFRNDKGRRVLNMPYWRRGSSGTFYFEFINEDTDAKALNELVKQGVVYIRAYRVKDGVKQYLDEK